MRVAERAYRSPLGRAMSAIGHRLAQVQQPFMIYGYYDHASGTFRKWTRMSSTVTIMNKKALSVDDQVWVWHYTILDATEGNHYRGRLPDRRLGWDFYSRKRKCYSTARKAVCLHSEQRETRLHAWKREDWCLYICWRRLSDLARSDSRKRLPDRNWCTCYQRCSRLFYRGWKPGKDQGQHTGHGP